MMDDKEWRFLLAGPTGEIKTMPNPTVWISENSWPDIYRQLYAMSNLEALKGLDEHFM